MSASQSCTSNSDVGADKCIDGDFGSICHTCGGGHPAPWLAIDYGTSVTIQRVEIFNRHDYGWWRTRNVDVRISDELPTSGSQMFSGGTLFGHFAGPGTDGQHIVISGEKQLWKSKFLIIIPCHQAKKHRADMSSVSYTHLTLPTILLV